MTVHALDYAPRQTGVRLHFSLGELLLTVVILAALGAVVVPRFRGTHCGSSHADATHELTTLGWALDAFKEDTGQYPDDNEGLAALLARPCDRPGWRGPYLARVSTDPWGTPFAYTRDDDGQGYQITSAGRDGVMGTPDDISAK